MFIALLASTAMVVAAAANIPGQNPRTNIADEKLDVVVVGAGFSGMYLLHQLRKENKKVLVIDSAGDVGGTWYWNRYPGARCDIESTQYSYDFDDELLQEWSWKERYAQAPEIRAYAFYVADKYDLRKDILFNNRVTKMTFEEDVSRWTLETDTGGSFSAKHVILATGCISAFNKAKFENQASFEGEQYFTGLWPHEHVDFTSKRVAVIGTGSSGIQVAPRIAGPAASLSVFQRTPQHVVPQRNLPTDKDEERELKKHYFEWRAQIKRESGFNAVLTSGEESFYNLTEAGRKEALDRHSALGGTHTILTFGPSAITDVNVSQYIGDYFTQYMRDIVNDPDTAEKLTPKYLFACKRLIMSDAYYPMFNRDSVSLVTSGIQSFTKNGIVTEDGVQHAFDAIVHATGFDTMTGSALRIDITGQGGLSLNKAWENGGRTYLGTFVPSFPNMYLISGPQSPSVLTNMIPTVQQHSDWVIQSIRQVDDNEYTSIACEESATAEWVALNDAIASMTIWDMKDHQCNSWYRGANIHGKPTHFYPFPGGTQLFQQKWAEAIKEDWKGFVFS